MLSGKNYTQSRGLVESVENYPTHYDFTVPYAAADLPVIGMSPATNVRNIRMNYGGLEMKYFIIFNKKIRRR